MTRVRVGLALVGLAVVMVGTGTCPAAASTDTAPVASKAERKAIHRAGGEVVAGVPNRCHSFRRFVDARRWVVVGPAVHKPDCTPYDGVAVFQKRPAGWVMVTAGSDGLCPDLTPAPIVVREAFGCEG